MKDSSEVIEFRSLYHRLKDWCEESPARLPDLCDKDESVRQLCLRLHFTSCFMKYGERLRPELYASPVDPDFIKDWREYEKLYEPVLDNIFTGELLSELGLDEEVKALPGADHAHRFDCAWRDADHNATEFADLISKAMQFAREQASHESSEYSTEARECVRDGVSVWESVQGEAGLDMRGILRRRKLVPFVLIPRPIAARSERTTAMLRNLEQAQVAFVFGAPYAALTLMRAILEAVLRDHFRTEGENLGEMLRNVDKSRLPHDANIACLHVLRKAANTILHETQERKTRLDCMDEIELEKEVVRLLRALRALIEESGRVRMA